MSNTLGVITYSQARTLLKGVIGGVFKDTLLSKTPHLIIMFSLNRMEMAAMSLWLLVVTQDSD